MGHSELTQANVEEILTQVDLTLANAKRVRNEARIVVQDLARIRDSLTTATAQGGTSTDERSSSNY